MKSGWMESPLRTLRKAALVLGAFSLVPGCGGTVSTDTPPGVVESEEVSVSFNISALADASEPGAGPSRGGVSSLSMKLGDVSAQAFAFSDVKQIRIDVLETANSRVWYRNFDMQQVEATREWIGTLPAVPKNKGLTFVANARKQDGTLLFSGSTNQTLTTDNQTVGIALSPANNGQAISLARIRQVSIPSAFGSDQSGNVSFTVEANTGERLSYVIEPASGGGSFQPVSGSITLLATTGTFVSQYQPPTVTAETEFTHVVRVTNEGGHMVSTTFKTKVKPNGKVDTVKDSRLAVQFNPVINALKAQRVLGTGNVLWEATVSDDGAPEALTYAWSFTPNGTYDPAPAFTDQANPTTLQNYVVALQGTLQLEVTDGNGGKTTLQYPLTPNQFPDNPIVEGTLSGMNSIRTGESHTCVLFNNGNMRCWGRNASGQLGYGNTYPRGDDEHPYVAGDLALDGVGAKLAVGGNHTCALTDVGLVRCWGLNSSGQLGYNSTDNVGDGEAIASYGYVNLGGTAVKVAMGLAHGCALMDTGKVRCWGQNNHGQLGYGHTNNVGDNELPYSQLDVNVGGTVKDIVAGGYHTCALLDTGKVRCWGYGGHGQLGYRSNASVGTTGSNLPVNAGDVTVGGTVIQLTAGLHHTCALLDTGNVRCWGYNDYGQLGYGNNVWIGDTEYPEAAGDVNTGGRVLQVTAGQHHTCALLSTGTVKCWGLGTNGRLGYGNQAHQLAPPASTVDLSGATASQVSAGGGHTCVLLSTGKARCWGLNDNGQLGYSRPGNQHLGDDEAASAWGDIQVLAP